MTTMSERLIVEPLRGRFLENISKNTGKRGKTDDSREESWKK